MTSGTTISSLISPAQDRLGRVVFVLAVAALALSPTQLVLPRLPLSASEAALGLAGLLWAVRWLMVRDTRSLPPLSNWLPVVAALISVVGLMSAQTPADRGAFVSDLLKLVLYLLIGVTVFRSVFTSPQRIRLAVCALLAATTLAVALALVQRIQLATQYQPDPARRAVYEAFTPRAYLTAETPQQVASTFATWSRNGYHPSRMAYAGYLALVLPLALTLLVLDRRRWVIVWLGLLCLGAAATVLAGWVVPAMLAGVLVTGAALGGRTGRFTVLGILGYLCLAAFIGGHQRTEVLHEPYRLMITPAEARYRYEGETHLKKFWGEQFAALNLIRVNPLFGVGLGQYQQRIHEGYGSLGAVSDQRLEPEAQNGYLLFGVETGMLGLAALLALFGSYLGLAWRQWRVERSPWSAALLGAMVALVLMTAVTNSCVRGSLLVVAALFGMLGYRATIAARTGQMEKED